MMVMYNRKGTAPTRAKSREPAYSQAHKQSKGRGSRSR